MLRERMKRSVSRAQISDPDLWSTLGVNPNADHLFFSAASSCILRLWYLRDPQASAGLHHVRVPLDVLWWAMRKLRVDE